MAIAKRKALSSAEKTKLIVKARKASGSGLRRKRGKRGMPLRRIDPSRQLYWNYVSELTDILPHVLDAVGPELATLLMDEGTSDEAVDQIVDIADKIVAAERDRLGVGTKPWDRY